MAFFRLMRSCDNLRAVNFHHPMKSFCFIFVLAGMFLASQPVPAQDQATNAAMIAAAAESARQEKHITPILAALQLKDLKREHQLREVLLEQFQALKSWHAQNDPQIKPLWDQFNAARAKSNVTDAAAVLRNLDQIYSGFQQQHAHFIAALSELLTPGQVESVKDTLTVNKVKVTYNVYLQIFPKLSEEQKAEALKELKAAREQAIDCESMTEKSAFFKKYKIQIEDEYLTTQGYNPKQARKDFARRQKADAGKVSPDEAK